MANGWMQNPIGPSSTSKLCGWRR
ncbi:hypothetical protein ACNKHX_03520 [Shigella flexneri]